MKAYYEEFPPIPPIDDNWNNAFKRIWIYLIFFVKLQGNKKTKRVSLIGKEEGKDKVDCKNECRCSWKYGQRPDSKDFGVALPRLTLQ